MKDSKIAKLNIFPSAGFVLTSVIVQVALSQTQQSLLDHFHDRQGFSLKQGLVKFSKIRAEERFQSVGGAGMSYTLPISLHYYCSYANVIYYLVQEWINGPRNAVLFGR